MLDTDDGQFGGHKRLDPNQHYFTQPVVRDNVERHYIKVYIPCRSALVIGRVPPAKASRNKKTV
jgi:1,4-alpha-glucan branching enzyme